MFFKSDPSRPVCFLLAPAARLLFVTAGFQELFSDPCPPDPCPPDSRKCTVRSRANGNSSKWEYGTKTKNKQSALKMGIRANGILITFSLDGKSSRKKTRFNSFTWENAQERVQKVHKMWYDFLEKIKLGVSKWKTSKWR